jgi:hypothetical protein
LITTVLPAARAGAIPQPASRKGKFQGKMKPHGPQGCRDVQASCRANGQHAALLDMLRHVREITHRVDEVLHIPGRLWIELAAIQRFDLRDDRLAGLDRVGQPMQRGRPFRRRPLAHPDSANARAAAWTARSTSSACSE